MIVLLSYCYTLKCCHTFLMDSSDAHHEHIHFHRADKVPLKLKMSHGNAKSMSTDWLGISMHSDESTGIT